MNRYPTYRFISTPIVPVQRRRYISIWNTTGSGKILKIIGVGMYGRPAASFAQSKTNIHLFRNNDIPTAWSSSATPVKFDSQDPDLSPLVSGLIQVTAGSITNDGGSIVAAGSQSVDDNTMGHPLNLYESLPSIQKKASLTIRENTGVTLVQDNWNVATGAIVGFIDFYVL